MKKRLKKKVENNQTFSKLYKRLNKMFCLKVKNYKSKIKLYNYCLFVYTQD